MDSWNLTYFRVFRLHATFDATVMVLKPLEYYLFICNAHRKQPL